MISLCRREKVETRSTSTSFPPLELQFNWPEKSDIENYYALRLKRPIIIWKSLYEMTLDPLKKVTQFHSNYYNTWITHRMFPLL